MALYLLKKYINHKLILRKMVTFLRLIPKITKLREIAENRPAFGARRKTSWWSSSLSKRSEEEEEKRSSKKKGSEEERERRH